jgi:hypothetical protein
MIFQLLVKFFLLLLLLCKELPRFLELLILLFSLFLEPLLDLLGLLERLRFLFFSVSYLLLHDHFRLNDLRIHTFRLFLEVKQVFHAHAFFNFFEIVRFTLHQVLRTSMRSSHHVIAEVHASFQLLLQAYRSLLVLDLHLSHALNLGQGWVFWLHIHHSLCLGLFS